jgi:hypothetical protein
MEKFDLRLMEVCELNFIELQKTNAGFWAVAIAFVAGALLGGLIYDVTKAAAIESNEALKERASEDDYIIWADVGHR